MKLSVQDKLKEFRVKLIKVGEAKVSMIQDNSTYRECEFKILDGDFKGQNAALYVNNQTKGDLSLNLVEGNVFSGANLLRYNDKNKLLLSGESNFKLEEEVKNFQQCAHLVDNYKDYHSESKDTLGDILNLQADTQKNVYGYDFENMSLRDLMNFWHMNNFALFDEIHEATAALGGIKDGNGNAIWKRWKKAYSAYSNMKFTDLSDSDQLECKFEIVDILHFFMNMAVSIGMTEKEMYNLYMLKNEENRNRQKNGY